MDIGYLFKNDAEEKAPFIVVRDAKTRMTFAHLLQSKATVNAEHASYTVNCIVSDLKYLDYKKVILKSDQEPAMRALHERVRQARSAIGEQTLPENSPVGESQSNGMVEEAIKDVKELLRTLVSALEESLGARLPQESAVFAWAVEYAAVLLNYFKRR